MMLPPLPKDIATAFAERLVRIQRLSTERPVKDAIAELLLEVMRAEASNPDTPER